MDVDVRSEAAPERAPHPRGRWRRAAVVTAAFAAGAVLSGGGAVWASHQFSDVPDSNPFHADIDWMVDNGIADGYADGTFKPTNPVSRQAFAAFLHRYNGEIETVVANVDPPAGTYFGAEAICPTGKRAVAGGSVAPVTTPTGLGLTMVRSTPSFGGASWQVAFAPIDGNTTDPATMVVTALCVPV